MTRAENRAKNRFMRICLLIGSLLIMIGVILLTQILIKDDERNNIKVYLADGKTEIIKFDSLTLVPGDECRYIVKLKSTHSNRYQLNLDFVETEENTLKSFARVRIESKGEVLWDELMATIFEEDALILPVDFKTKENTELTIVYYLPLEVGNEAKNAEAIFELLLQVGNE